MSNWISSSKRHPCPVCNRDKDGDCRTSEADNVVLCHTHTQPTENSNHYKFLHPSKDGLWGVWIYQQENATNGKISGKKPPGSGHKRQPFYYDDRSGQRLIMVVRREGDHGKKSFSQHKWTGVEWESGLNDYAKQNVPIYRYSEVRAAIAQGKPIFMVEGEGKADELWKIGIPATTTIGGSKKYRAYGSYADDLSGAKLLLCPDRDKTGIEHMEDIASDFPEAKWCYVFPQSPLWNHIPDSGGLDIADWIRDGATATDILANVGDKRSANAKSEKPKLDKADLISRVKNLDLVESPVDRIFEEWDLTRISGKNKRELMELAIALRSDLDLSDEEWAPTAKAFAAKPLASDEWVFSGFLKAGRTCLIAAESKMGKSLLHYDWSYEIATGGMWGEFPTPKARPVIIVQTDEPQTDCQERIKARGLAELDNVRIVTKFMPQHLLRLKRLMQSMGPGGVVVLDSLTSINRFSGYSPKDPEYAYFVYELKDLMDEIGWTAILITHTNKSPLAPGGEKGIEKIAGSFAIGAGVSDILMLDRVPGSARDDRTRLLHRLGGRSGAPKTWKLELNLEDYSYEWFGESDYQGQEKAGSEDTKVKAFARNQILAFLQSNAGLPYESSEISFHLDKSNDRVRLLLGEMFREGLIYRRKASNGTRANVYYVPEVTGLKSQQSPDIDRELSIGGLTPRSNRETLTESQKQVLSIGRSKESAENLEQNQKKYMVQSNYSTPEVNGLNGLQPSNSTNTPHTFYEAAENSDISFDRPIDSHRNSEASTVSRIDRGEPQSDRKPRSIEKDAPPLDRPIDRELPPLLRPGSTVRYLGYSPHLIGRCGSKALKIERIEGDIAIVRADGWETEISGFAKPFESIPLCDLRQIT